MTIMLGGVTLPSGLRWSDEFDFRFDTTASAYSISGALIIDRGTKQAGRPVTLTGGKEFAWLTRADVKAIQTLLESYPSSGLTLVLHDARELTVMPAPGDALKVNQVPLVAGEGVADPVDATKYYIDYIKLLQI